ncbi:uncharacterized protein UV8b_00561 [Ustilaginoidea virens]|uniref:DUF1742-domain-containing protein n=1 Tax=Ustilaginoidea virens TaxID=1159556 RepID=A0A8E5HJB7_USTVR|nr:uncharacterized protein UV8b_00561 [Ustilaginoidea virens]QUC16320.1 hypothetical protein UV8b_00561 [Ustilaginoidea virens]
MAATMAAPFPNLYVHRRVADAAAKSCDVCYKTSSSVLITPDSKDFFYVCPAHLKDTYFCTPRVDAAAVEARREKALAEEKERLKKEYEEKLRKKTAKKAKEAKEAKEAAGKAEQEDEEEAKDKNRDAKDVESAAEGSLASNEEPRLFQLGSAFYQQRLQRKRQAEAARRDRERASQPGYFPSVPSEPPTR